MRLALGLSLLLFATAASADDTPAIVVTAAPSSGRVLPPQVELSGAALVEAQPLNVADALRGLPGVSIRTGSRGETIARVRGSEERQTAVFLDGAPLQVPWDGRVDLGILPPGLIDDILVTKGAVPVEFGANAIGGVVELRTRGGEGRGVTALGELGTHGFVNASAVAAAGDETLHATFGAGWLARDALAVARRSALPFSQADSNRRTNTDLDSFSLFGAVGGRVRAVQARMSVLHNDTRRGIAPESDRDPAAFAPRYWRYPDIRLTQAALNLRAELGPDADLTAVVWRQWFGQTILAYRDATYRQQRSTQDDSDGTTGGRFVLSHGLGPARLRWAGSIADTGHRQIDTPVPGAPGLRLEYRQRLLSGGIEADLPLWRGGRLTAGAAYDRSETPQTGDKPAQPAQDAFGWSAGLRQTVTNDLALTVTAGRRTRFATSRELYGEALGRFLLNPDLRPEQAFLLDGQLAWTRPGLRVTVNPFYVRGRDTLGQRVVRVGGASLRQRFNLSGTSSYGVDALIAADLIPNLAVTLTGTALSARSDPGDAAFRRLPQRPGHEAAALVTWRPAERVTLTAEALRTGPAVDQDAAGARVRLEPGTEVNLRGAVTLFRLGGQRVLITAAAENIGDAVITPQSGLPLPGRTVRIGIRTE